MAYRLVPGLEGVPEIAPGKGIQSLIAMSKSKSLAN